MGMLPRKMAQLGPCLPPASRLLVCLMRSVSVALRTTESLWKVGVHALESGLGHQVGPHYNSLPLSPWFPVRSSSRNKALLISFIRNVVVGRAARSQRALLCHVSEDMGQVEVSMIKFIAINASGVLMHWPATAGKVKKSPRSLKYIAAAMGCHHSPLSP
jgi:hypothetical protein